MGNIRILAAALVLGAATTASAGTFTIASPTSAGDLPAGVTVIGGVVFDAVGTNGTRLVSQTPASSLFVGQPGFTPFTIGTQGGFTPGVLGAMGGGFSEVAVRFTLFDGDTAPGNFDFNDNTLLLNGLSFGNWSDVLTVETSSTGTILSGPDAGFNNNDLDTGFFYSNNAGLLASLFASMSGTQSVVFGLFDADTPGDNFFDFTRGIDGGLIDVGTPPVVTPAVPLPPAAWMGLGMLGLLGLARRGRKKSA